MIDVEESDPTLSIVTSVKKRSTPFGIIGSVSKALFGTLSEDDGQYYNKKIKELFTGQIDLAKMAEEETHLVQHQLASLSSQLDRNKAEIKQTYELYAQTVEKMDDLANKWHYSEVLRQFTATTNAVEAALTLYKDTFTKLLQIIHASRLGQLHPSLLSTKRLQQIVRQIIDLHPEYEFPIPISHARTDKLSEITSLKLAYKNSTFLIEVVIPMLNKFPTELYRMHPVPIPQIHENHSITAYIHPQTPYIALSHDKRAYSLLTETNLNDCKHTDYYKICTHDEPIHETDSKMTCEYLLLNQPSEENIKQCRIKIMLQYTSHWIHLKSLNGWLYSTNKPSVVQILCPGKSHQLINIEGIGILQLKPRCSARHDHVTLMGKKSLGQTTEFLYLPAIQLNISNLDNTFFHMVTQINDSLPESSFTTTITPSKLESDLSLQNIQDRYKTFINKRNNEKFQTNMIYGSLAINLVIALIISVLVIILCASCSSYKIENPKIRSASSISDSIEFNAPRPICTTEDPPDAPHATHESHERFEENITNIQVTQV